MKRRSNDLFGGPSDFSGGQLPTYGDVGRQWKACCLELESAQPGTKIKNREIAQDVMCLYLTQVHYIA